MNTAEYHSKFMLFIVNGIPETNFFDNVAKIDTVCQTHFKLLKKANKYGSNHTCFD